VGEGNAASGEDGWVASIVYSVLLGCELRISDMTESRGPEISTISILGACRFQEKEIYSTIWVVHETTQRAMCVAITMDQLVTAPDEDSLRTSFHLALINMIRMRLRINAIADNVMVDPVIALSNDDPLAEEAVRRMD
jgi:hypothetical protein